MAHNGMFSNTSAGNTRSGLETTNTGSSNNQTQGSANEAGMFTETTDVPRGAETNSNVEAGMFDNAGASETSSGANAGMFDNESEGNRKFGTGANEGKEKGVLGKVKQAFVPGSGT